MAVAFRMFWMHIVVWHEWCASNTWSEKIASAAEHFTQAIAAHRAGQLQAAVTSYDAAISTCAGPVPASYFHNKGGALHALGDSTAALAAFERSLTVDPTHSGSLRASAALLFQANRFKDSVDAYETLLNLSFSPSAADVAATTRALAEHGRVLRSSGLATEAESAFARAVELDPTLDGAWYNRGYALQQIAQDGNASASALARLAYDRAVSNDPRHRPLCELLSDSDCTAVDANGNRSVVQLRWPPHVPPQHASRVYTRHIVGESEDDFSEADNTQLHHKILEMASVQASAAVSNQGGWHSGADGVTQFLDLSDSAILRLRRIVLQAVSEYLLAEADTEATMHLDSAEPEPGRVLNKSAKLFEQASVSFDGSWANVNWHGHSNQMHDHGGVTISGCYYVASGYGAHETNAVTSMLIGVPIHSQDASTTPDAQLSYQLTDTKLEPVSSSGQLGQLLLWPGYVRHEVPAHHGSLPRISVAFNIFVSIEQLRTTGAAS